MSATLNGTPIAGATSISTQDPTQWHQCAAPGVDPTVDTWVYGQGAVPLTLSASDAAGVPVNYTKTVYIDNSQPTVSFSGPTDAPSTAGVQYVNASAGGSPSGIAGLYCSVDGAPGAWTSGSAAELAVSGVGTHRLRCAAANNAVDAAGNHGWSGYTSWTLTIREPTVTAIGFSRLVDRLRCHRASRAVTIPARWITVHRHHRLVSIREPARTTFRTVTLCHPRIQKRTIIVWATSRRHGKAVRIERRKTIRVALLPHQVMSNWHWVWHGRPSSVSGWLGMPDGTALPGQIVHVFTAPDNGLGQFSLAAAVITGSDGSWTAQLPAGPARLVEAIYDGSPTLEPSSSAQVKVIVPAKIRLISVWPARVAWGGTVHIVGQILGGYLPVGGALVRLRIGEGSSYTTYGVQEHVTGSGRFSTTYTFGAGLSYVYQTFWFQLATLPMSNMPWAPADSAKQTVLVGGHPAIPAPPGQRRTRSRDKTRYPRARTS
jgi:hypothetical protein